MTGQYFAYLSSTSQLSGFLPSEYALGAEDSGDTTSQPSFVMIWE
jgi:hypothetical protein